MRLRLGISGLVAALALGSLPLGAGLLTAPLASAVTIPKVMIVGDSVAHQFDGDYTWRYRLWAEFKRQKKAVDFVGPFRWSYGDYHNYLSGSGWDSDHDAQGATEIPDFMDLSPTPSVPTQGQFNIVPTMTKYKPDVIVCVMANNDVNGALSAGFPSVHQQIAALGQTPDTENAVDTATASVLDDYKAFLASVRQVKPNVKIVIAQVTSQLIEPWVRTRFNAALAAQLVSTPTSPVVIARTNDVKLSKPGYTVDGIHTTPTGDFVMAQHVAQGLHDVWPALLGTPKVPQLVLPWAPKLKPSVKVSGGHIAILWGVTARSNTVLGIRVKLVDVTRKKTGYGTFAHTNGWTSGVMKPGKYRVRVQGIRGNMTSTWSPVFPVTVPKPR